MYDNKKPIISASLLLVYCFLSFSIAYAEILERIVVVVNEDVILLSELRNEVQSRKVQGIDAADTEVLDEIINRRLLLEQAAKMRIQGDAESDKSLSNDETIINDYIERRVKTFIHIPLKDIEDYYNANAGAYGNKKFYEVKSEIESELLEDVLKEKLREHIRDLRKDSYIRLQLE